MKTLKNNVLPLSLILLALAVNSLYGILNNSSRGVSSLVTDFDRSIPFLSGFVIPYVAWYPFLMFAFLYLCFKYSDIYYNTIWSLIIGILICYCFYYFFQTTVPRPDVIGEGPLQNLVRLVYNTDNPYNCFPSIHVLSSFIIMKGFSKSNASKIFKYMVYTIGVLIILSTQFIKQHVLLDVLSAILLGEYVYRAVEYLALSGGSAWTKKLSWLWTTKKNLET
jgi:hypothetical protein